MFENRAICGIIHLGKRGENLARRIVFDECRIWESEFGKGKYYLFHQRNGDAAPYPVALKVEDGSIYWEVSSLDTSMEGEGKCELRYVVGDVVVKSHTWKTVVSEGLDNSSTEPPEAAKAWVDQVLDAAKKVEGAKAWVDEVLEAVEEIKDVSDNLKENNAKLEKAIEEAESSIDKADKAEKRANDAADETREVLEEAKNILTHATAATQEAIQKTEEAVEAINRTNEATTNAVKATTNAVEATDKANESANRVDMALNTVSNALKGKETGEAVAMKDVSPIEHEMKVKASSKNLFDIDSVAFDGSVGGGFISQSIQDGKITVKASGINQYNSALYTFANKNLFGKTITISFDAELSGDAKAGLIGIIIVYADGKSELLSTKSTLTIPKYQEGCYLRLRVYCQTYGNSEDESTITYSNIQIEEGTVATPYTPFVDVSTAKLIKRGTNLIPFPYADGGIGTVKENEGITFTVNEDRSITISGTSTNKYAYFYMGLKMPFGEDSINAIREEQQTNGIYVASKRLMYDGSSGTLTVAILPNTTVNETIYPQIEVGTKATPYEPYIEPIEYPIGADGTVEGVTSLSPTTTLYADTAGVKIEVGYNKDINAVINDILKRIAATEKAII